MNRTVFDGLLRVEAKPHVSCKLSPLCDYGHNLRSLLTSETLENDLGVAVDTQIVDSLCVCRGP